MPRLVLSILAAAAIVAVLRGYAEPPAPSAPPANQVITREGVPLAVYRRQDETLVIHGTGTLLVCFGDDETHCELVRGWVAR